MLRRAALSAVLSVSACSAPQEERASEVVIALCQIEVVAELKSNLATITDAIARARAAGADLAVFPEACLFGWTNDAAHAGASEVPGAQMQVIAKAARAHGVAVVIGIEEKDGEALHNSVIYLDEGGSLVGKHRKVNILEELMDPPYTPGAGEPAVFDTRWGRVGLLICADTFEQPLVQRLAAEEPDLVLVPYGWAAPAGDWPQHADSLHAWIANTARVCNAPVVGVDSVGQLSTGPWKGFVLGGQSHAVDATGKTLATLADRVSDLQVVRLPLHPRSPQS